MGLFSKIKDYNIELDEILDNKYFSSNIKNLLLSMIYKLETSYDDYKEIKRCVKPKADFLNEIIEIIRLYCDNVKTVEPDSDQAKILIKNNVKALTNEKERSILTYPTENALFYAISDISPKYFYINQDFALKNLIQNSLVNGYNLNNMEILRDFNGWSWDKTYDEEFDYIDNLMYQNLLVIAGEKFLSEWRTYFSTQRDFLYEIKKFIRYFTGDDKYLNSLYKMIYLKSDSREDVDQILREKKKLLRKMENKAKFIEDLKNRKKNINKKLSKIDLILNDEEIIEKEFIKTNLKKDKKIKSLKKYKELLIKERENYLNEISEIDYVLKPENFLKKRDLLIKSTELYGCCDSFMDSLIFCQKQFLRFIDKKLSKMKTRDEIIDIVYELRYYRTLKISNDTSISDIEEIKKYADKIMKKAITMLCKIGAMKIISMDIDLNFEIINYAIDTKIIELEKIKLCFESDSKGLIIKVYDKEVFEKQGRKKIQVLPETLEVKQNRKIKLFN